MAISSLAAFRFQPEVALDGAKEQSGKTERGAVERFNRLRDWLKHPTPQQKRTAEVTNYDALSMIVRAVTKIEAVHPGSETSAIAAFVDFSRQHYADFVRPGRSLRAGRGGATLPGRGFGPGARSSRGIYAGVAAILASDPDWIDQHFQGGALHVVPGPKLLELLAPMVGVREALGQ